MRTRRVAAVTTVAICVGAGGWLLRGHDAAHSAAPPPDMAVPVTSGVALAQDVPIYVQGVGTIQAINTVNVKSRVDGEIMQAFFTPSQEVEQNDRLFLIDPRPYQAALDQAKANEAKNSAQLIGAQRDLDRYGKLVGSGFQTRQSFEDQQATVAQLQGAVQADQAAMETAQLNLGFTLVRAPFAGRIGARLIDPGNFVQASRRYVAGVHHPNQADLCKLHLARDKPGCDPSKRGDAQTGGGCHRCRRQDGYARER